jgi:uncharacterized protein involved in exopolysaccharide biosynthesis
MENSHNSEQLIDFKELFSILWNDKYWIALCTSGFAILSVSYALSLPNIYYSESLLKLSSQTNASQPSSLPSQFGSIASMTGLDFGIGNDLGKTTSVLSTIQSRDFLKRLIEIEWVLPGLMAAGSYDPDSKKLT